MDILEKLEKKIKSEDWLKKRDFRGDRKELESLFWNVLAIVLISSVKREGEIYLPDQYQAIVVASFNTVFINAAITREEILELGRGFPRGYWDTYQNKLVKTVEQLIGENRKEALHLHQSILASINDNKLIKRVEPYTINVKKFDTYQKKLDQSVLANFKQIYPRQLIIEDDIDCVLINNLVINERLVQEYMKMGINSVRMHYGLFLFERMNEFFVKNPDINSFSEDKLV